MILIDTDSSSDCGNYNEGTDTGFFIISKQENLDEPVETVSHSSSVSLPDLSLSDCEVSVSDSVTVVPATTAAAVEPERLRTGYMSRSPILQKFMKTSLLFKENPASDEGGVSEANCELKANLNALFDSSASMSKGDVLDECISDDNSDIVELGCEMQSANSDIGCLSRCVLSEKLNCNANSSVTGLVSIADPTNTSLPDTAMKMRLTEEMGDLEASRPANEMPSSNCKGKVFINKVEFVCQLWYLQWLNLRSMT